MHSVLGERKHENLDDFTSHETEELKDLLLTAVEDPGLLSSAPSTSKKLVDKSKTTHAENKETKRQTILTANKGLETNYQKGIVGFDMINVDKISIHKGVINEEIDTKKVDSLVKSLLLHFDPTLSVIYVTPTLKRDEKYDKSDKQLNYKALDGRHLLTAIKAIYSLGKSLKGLDPNMVMVVVLDSPGIIAANYANMRHRFLKDKYSSKVLIQDFVKLYLRIYDVTHDKDQSLEIAKNAMVSFDFQKDDVTAIVRMTKWSHSTLQLASEIFEAYESFQTLEGMSSKKKKEKKLNLRLPIPKLSFHRIAKLKEADILEVGRDVLECKIKFSDLSKYSVDTVRLENIKNQVIEITKELTGEEFEDYAELSQTYKNVDNERLSDFLFAGQGPGYKTGDRIKLERYMKSVLNCVVENVEMKTTYEKIDDISSDKLSSGDLIILYANHTDKMTNYFLRMEIPIIFVCRTQKMLHQILKTIFMGDGEEKVEVSTVVAKDSENKVMDGNVQGGLTYLIIAGEFESAPLKVLFDSLQAALSDTVDAILQEVRSH